MNNPIDHVTPCWQAIERRPTWAYVSVQEVAQALGTSPQNVHNWIGRGWLPKTERKPGFSGNKAFFQIASLRAHLERRSENDIHREFIDRFMPDLGIEHIGQARYLVKHCHQLLGVERP